MNYCTKCLSYYQKPGTCNCYAQPQPVVGPIQPTFAPYELSPPWRFDPWYSPHYPTFWGNRTTTIDVTTFDSTSSRYRPDGDDFEDIPPC
jgi:hypothetical protein